MMQQIIQLCEIEKDGLKQYILSDVTIPDSKVLATYSDVNQIVQLQNMTIMNNSSDVTYYTRTLSDVGRQNISKSSKRQAGKGNSQYGTRWIHSLKKSKRIRATDDLPEGWSWGRKIKFED